MKQFLLLIIISVIFSGFTVKKYSAVDITQLVVTIPELSTFDLKERLEMDFRKMDGIRNCEASLMTKTLLMKYDGRKVSADEIHSIFQKWGCNPEEYSYQKLY